MDEKTPTPIVKATTEQEHFWDRHRLTVLLIATVFVAIVMTIISVAIYNTSGAAQLDLSRPGYRSVSDQATKTDDIDTYSASGDVDKESIEEFMKLYDKQALKAKAVDAFNGDPLNPEVLEFGEPVTE